MEVDVYVTYAMTYANGEAGNRCCWLRVSCGSSDVEDYKACPTFNRNGVMDSYIPARRLTESFTPKLEEGLKKKLAEKGYALVRVEKFELMKIHD